MAQWVNEEAPELLRLLAAEDPEAADELRGLLRAWEEASEAALTSGGAA